MTDLFHTDQQLAQIRGSAVRCQICHRVLTDPDSVRAGIGPVCQGRFSITTGGSMHARTAHYSQAWSPGHVLLHDLGPHDKFLTITNAAEQVVEELVKGGLGDRRVFYYDTDGRLDELVVKDGKFHAFAPLSDNMKAAIQHDYNYLREISFTIDGIDITTVCGIHRFMYTVGVLVGINRAGYRYRLCFDSELNARLFLADWDGVILPKVGVDGCVAIK